MFEEILKYKELLKLFGILFGGILVSIIGFIIQKKSIAKKKAEQEKMNSHYSSSNSSMGEDYSNETIKNYILQYKTTYSRDSIKTALVTSGNSSEDVEKYLNKFF